MLIEFKEHLAYLEKIRAGEIKTATGLGIKDFDEHFDLTIYII